MHTHYKNRIYTVSTCAGIVGSWLYVVLACYGSSHGVLISNTDRVCLLLTEHERYLERREEAQRGRGTRNKKNNVEREKRQKIRKSSEKKWCDQAKPIGTIVLSIRNSISQSAIAQTKHPV